MGPLGASPTLQGAEAVTHAAGAMLRILSLHPPLGSPCGRSVLGPRAAARSPARQHPHSPWSAALGQDSPGVEAYAPLQAGRAAARACGPWGGVLRVRWVYPKSRKIGPVLNDTRVILTTATLQI